MKEGLVETDLFGFLTAEPNALVGAYHRKAMPVNLATPNPSDRSHTKLMLLTKLLK